VVKEGSDMTTTLERVSSADGTQIALEAAGTGRRVVLIGGAFNDRTTMTGLARVLSRHYQAVIYDRRGRGDSDDVSADYSVEREMEDLRRDRACRGHRGSFRALFRGRSRPRGRQARSARGPGRRLRDTFHP
jgi:pimeloyl-ACP methyl ester carboxylesterase